MLRWQREFWRSKFVLIYTSRVKRAIIITGRADDATDEVNDDDEDDDNDDDDDDDDDDNGGNSENILAKDVTCSQLSAESLHVHSKFDSLCLPVIEIVAP